MFSEKLPQTVVHRANSLGQAGQDWLAGLDQMVQETLTTQQLTFTSVLAGGTESLVLSAERSDGTAAILKFGLPGSADLSVEAKVYRLAEGHGYADLLHHDPQHNLIILEKLGPPLEHEKKPVKEQIRILSKLMMSSWIELSEDEATQAGFMTGAEKADWHVNFLQEQLQQRDLPCSQALIECALTFAAQRKAAYNPQKSVLVHGDAHSLNTLQSNGNYKFIDPDGLFGEPALDLCLPMREYNDDLLAGNVQTGAVQRCHDICSISGVAAEPIWQWGLVERVSSAFVLAMVDLQDEARKTFDVAEQIYQITV